MKKSYTGINIQWPISELIRNGQKNIETRVYPIPVKYLNKEMLLIETPGKSGKFKSRAIAIIKFTNCFQYKSKTEFKNDYAKHLVEPDSAWDWKDKPKWGWEVKVIETLKKPKIIVKQKGIIYTNSLTL
jgi:hypothetical protein